MEPDARRASLERDAFLMTALLADQLSHEIDAVCQASGLTEQQYRVLWVLCLSGRDEGLPLGSISDGLITRASDVSRLVDRLEQAGHVERRHSTEDRRVVLVTATQTGRTTFEQITHGIKSLHVAQWGALETDELTELTDLLNRVFWSRRTDHGGPPR